MIPKETKNKQEKKPDQYIYYLAYPLELVEEGSVTNMFTFIVDNIFGFKAIRAFLLKKSEGSLGNKILCLIQ